MLPICMDMPDKTQQKMATCIRNIKTINPHSPGILVIYHIGALWQCLDKPEHAQQKLQSQFKAFIDVWL